MLALNQNEKVLLVLRRHRFILYSQFLVFAFIILAPFVLYTILAAYLPQWVEPPFNRLFLLAGIFYLLFLWAYIFIVWLNYYMDVWIVTDARIVDIELHGLFEREHSEFMLSRVQDVTVAVNGVFQTMFDFGNVQVQTAGEAKSFIFYEVPHPYKVKETILKAQDGYMNKKLVHRHDTLESA